jgi:hypothetical protein
VFRMGYPWMRRAIAGRGALQRPDPAGGSLFCTEAEARAAGYRRAIVK